MGQAGSVPGQGVSSLAAAELCKKWMLQMRRSSRMAVTDSGYPGEAGKKKIQHNSWGRKGNRQFIQEKLSLDCGLLSNPDGSDGSLDCDATAASKMTRVCSGQAVTVSQPQGRTSTSTRCSGSQPLHCCVWEGFCRG